jgi:integrase
MSECERRTFARAVHETSPAEPPKPRLLDRVREALRARHYSRRTEKAYVAWIRRYILFHHKRHPLEMGAPEITRFLSALAVEGNVAASTQNQALSALLFLYREVLDLDVPWLDDLVRAKRPIRLPIVLTREEVGAVLQPLEGVPRLMAYLLYGAGLRVLECCRLRVQDVDFARNQIVVRNGKGAKDRATMLPDAVKTALKRHLDEVREQHQRGPSARRRLGRASYRARAEVSERRPRVGMAMGVSGNELLHRTRHPPAATSPSPRVGPPARREEQRPPGRDPEARHASHVAPFVRDPSPRGRIRHPHGPGAARPP